MKKSVIFFLPLLLICAVLLTACTSGNSLAGTTWTLVSYGDAANPTAAAVSVDTSLTFNKDGTVGGNMGCNGFGGDYSIRDNIVTFENIFSTMMACEEPRMSQETTTFSIMNGDVTFVVDGGTLTLTSAADGRVLVLSQN
jgi:heat shock protein HslJ